MQVTKYPQSCLLIEHERVRLVIDPGSYFTASFDLDDLGELDAVLVTHRHLDHIDPVLVGPLRERGIEIVGNADVADLLGEGLVRVVEDGQRFEVAGLDAVAHDLPHVPMVDGSPGPPNTGFVLEGRLFHPGDGVEITGLRVPNVAVPICGPSISFRDAYAFVTSLGAEKVIPVHYDAFVADPEHFARVCDLAEVIVLDDGDSTAI